MTTVREAAADDCRALLDLGAELRGVHLAHGVDTASAPPRRWTRGALARRVRDPFSALLVAEDEGVVVGYVSVHLVASSRSDELSMRLVRRLPVPLDLLGAGYAPDGVHERKRTAFVDEMVVAAHARRRGVGGTLADACLAWSRARGASAVELEVYDFNRGAIELYRSLGFVTRRIRMVTSLERQHVTPPSGQVPREASAGG